MKTVMKKIFSLMLVAVLLVSAVPFQASAHTFDEASKTVTVPVTVYINGVNKDGYNKQIVLNEGDVFALDAANALGLLANTANRSLDKWVSTTGAVLTEAAPGSINYETLSTYGENYALELYINETAATPPETTPPAPAPCGTCGNAAHEGVCCATCKVVGHAAADHCASCGQYDSHASNCPTTYVTIVFSDSVGGNTYSDIIAAPGETVTLPTVAWVSGYEPTGWNINGNLYGTTYTIPEGASGIIRASAGYVKRSEDLTSPLKVYANLYTGTVIRSTVLIHENKTLMDNDAILKYLLHADTQAQLWNTVNTKYPGYGWTGHIYNAFGKTVATDNITTIDGAKAVYINLYSKANDVLVYVHTAKSHSYNAIVQIDGYKTGETITNSVVKSNIKGYNTTGMKMYSDEAWNDLVNKGAANTDSTYVTVNSGVTKIHVLVSGYAASSSTSTADSTNPKTGDMIFVPVAALGLSASALAVLFFLNKKRAF